MLGLLLRHRQSDALTTRLDLIFGSFKKATFMQLKIQQTRTGYTSSWQEKSAGPRCRIQSVCDTIVRDLDTRAVCACLKCSIHSYDRRKILSSVDLFRKRHCFLFLAGKEFYAYFALYKETV